MRLVYPFGKAQNVTCEGCDGQLVAAEMARYNEVIRPVMADMNTGTDGRRDPVELVLDGYRVVGQFR